MGDSLLAFGEASGNADITAAANTILSACTWDAVPKPPVSFDPVSECVTTAMLTLNATLFA